MPGVGIGDSDMSWPVVDSEEVYRGSVIGVRRDTLTGSDGGSFDREIVTHHGAVAVLAIDDDDRVLVVSQYRHPARRRLVELPAGLLDHPGESRLVAAGRELAEEGQARADRWSLLLELMPSPGVSDEVVTVYLAEGVAHSDVPAGFVPRHEEASMTREWVRLGDIVEAVLAGRVKNAPLAAAALAIWVLRSRGDERGTVVPPRANTQ